MEEIKDIGMWEETDSELAKYNIQQAFNRVQDLKEQIQELFDEYLELKDKIDKVIEFVEKEPIDDEIEYTTRLLDILRGEDIKEIPQFEGTLEQLDKLSIRGKE